MLVEFITCIALCLLVVAAMWGISFFLCWLFDDSSVKYCHTHGCGAEYSASDGKCVVCRREIDDFEHMERQFNKYTCREVTMSKHWYVKNKTTGYFCNGPSGQSLTFETRGEALAKAQELARQNTAVTYLVIGPSDEVSANIPVDVKEWKQ